MVLVVAFLVALVVQEAVGFNSGTAVIGGVHADTYVVMARGVSSFWCHLSVRLFSAFFFLLRVRR